MAGDYNTDYGLDFSGGIRPKDFNFDFNNDFSGGYPPVIIPPIILPTIQSFPSEYVAVPANPLIQVLAEYRTIKIEPEGW